MTGDTTDRSPVAAAAGLLQAKQGIATRALGQLALQRCGIQHIDILADHTGTRADLRSVAGDSGHAMATTQGFFQQLATGTTGGPNDCDLAHDILQLA